MLASTQDQSPIEKMIQDAAEFDESLAILKQVIFNAEQK